MWKNYRLRRFHWIMTLVEFFLPILTAYAMGKITATLGGSTSSQKNATYFSEYGIQEFISRGEHSFLLYTPSNNFTDSLMLKVKDALGKNCSVYPNYFTSISTGGRKIVENLDIY